MAKVEWVDDCPNCKDPKHAGRCFVIRNNVQCECPERVAPKDADLGVDRDALATHQLNHELRQHGEVLITKDDES